MGRDRDRDRGTVAALGGDPKTIAELIAQLTIDAGTAPTALWSPESAFSDGGITAAVEQDVIQQVDDAVGNGYDFTEVAVDKGGIYMDARAAASTLIDNVAGYSATDTVLTVDDGTVFDVNDLVINTRTFEWMIVSATSATTITVSRGEQGAVAGTGIAILDNDPIQRLRVGSGPFIIMRRHNSDAWSNLQALNAVTPNGWAAGQGSMAFLGLMGDHVHNDASASNNPAILQSATDHTIGRDLTFYTRSGTADYFAMAVPAGVGPNNQAPSGIIWDEVERCYVGRFESGVNNIVSIDKDRPAAGTQSGSNTLTKKWVVNASSSRYGSMCLSILAAWNVTLTDAQIDDVTDTLRLYRGLAAV